MREIGVIDNELDATVFRDFLFGRGIEAQVEPDKNNQWSVWICDDDRLVESESLLARFKTNPQDAYFTAGADEGERKRKAREKEDEQFARKMRGRDAIWRTYGIAGMGPVTSIFLVTSILVSLIFQFGPKEALFQILAISTRIGGDLPEIRYGQVWRLFTPVFIHFGFIHLLFNMLWLRDLGGMIEQIKGARFILLFIGLTAALSNLAQFFISGPLFGGMSGVVYGLLGYVWMKSRFQPQSGFMLHPFTVQMMLVWLLLGASGLIGNIANTAHIAGLIMGVAWGYLESHRQVS